MKPEAQRIAIAEACGYIWERGCFGTPLGKKKGEVGPYEDLPDYLTDLNVMHDAEKVLRPDGAYGQWPLWDKYFKQLTWAIGEEDAVHATAAQRAEAFLRTIGKWEEST